MYRKFIASNSTEVLLLFTSLHAIVKSTNVVCPHNGTYDICVFVIFSKTAYVDIVRLWCKPLIRE